MTLQDAIKGRHSCRSFSAQPVEQYIVDEMLEMARLAPSGGNGQAHMFGVITDKELIEKLAHIAGGQTWISSAPLIFACCARLDEDFSALPSDDYGLIVNKRRFGEKLLKHIMAYENWEQTALLLADAVPLIPMEHMALTAQAYGLSCCFVGDLDVQKASELLRLPSGLACLYLLPTGYPSKAVKARNKKTANEISFYNYYSK